MGPADRPEDDLQLVRLIGQDGPFVVWRARPASHLGLPPWVLVRRPSSERTDRAALSARLERASRLAHEVAHPFVLPACGTLSIPNGDVAQILEDVDGIDLASCPIQERSLPLSAVVWLARQLLEALAHAHGLGFTHGNLTPAAVWVRRSGEIALDFGVATTTEDEELQTTQQVDLRFAHPRWEGESAGYQPKQDVYAVCAILWLLAVGSPYRATAGEMVHRRAGTLREGVSPLLEEVLVRGLGGIPGAPVPAAQALADDLSRVFYREMMADDDREGAEAVAAWARAALPKKRDGLKDGPVPSPELLQGRFTRTIVQPPQPVAPADLTPGDVEAVGAPAKPGVVSVVDLAEGPAPTSLGWSLSQDLVAPIHAGPRLSPPVLDARASPAESAPLKAEGLAQGAESPSSERRSRPAASAAERRLESADSADVAADLVLNSEDLVAAAIGDPSWAGSYALRGVLWLGRLTWFCLGFALTLYALRIFLARS